MTSCHSHIAFLAILVVLLAGCGQKSAKTEERAARPATASTPPAQPPPPAPEQRPPAEPPGAAPRAVTASPSSPQPAPAAPGPPQSIEEFTEEPALQDVFFAAGRVDIGPSAVRFMRENARWINENRGYLVLIEGHSDNRGTPENNFAMGDRRAKAAATFFLKEGVADTRLFTVSHGSDRPVCDEKTDACAARNRRVHFRVKKQ